MISAIKKRRSVREYLAGSVSEEKLTAILTSAMYSPSANAIYPWELVVVKNPQTKDLLSKVTPWSTHIKEADVVIAVVGNEKESPDWVEDCSIVAEHLWLAITDEDLGLSLIHI